MKTPPLLLAAGLLFWGWHTDHLLLAAGMAIILEAARFFPFKWEYTLVELQRVWLICFLLFGGICFYPFVVFVLVGGYREGFQVIRDFQPFPIIFFPLLVCQVYSPGRVVDLRAFRLKFQEKQQIARPFPIPFDLTYPYLILCCFRLGQPTIPYYLFFIGIFVLTLWTFWSFRSRRYSPVIWLAALAVVGMIGYAGYLVFPKLGFALARQELLFRFFQRSDLNPYHSATAIGDIGTVKLSNNVVFRIRSESGPQPFLLLKEAIYNRYQRSNWYSSSLAQFVTIPSEIDETTWIIQPELKKIFSEESSSHQVTEPQRVTISSYLQNKQAVLKLPSSTFQIERLLVGVMTKNRFGTIHVEEGPDLISYQALFRSTGAFDSPPTDHDLAIPETEEPVIRQLAEELHLTLRDPENSLQRITAFFQANFSYSLVLGVQDQKITPLADFLLNTRSGHCEYFATTTVLLLRAAGIPARYAAGYAVEDLSQERWKIVRGRHAHSWALVYLNNVWHDFDTTPSAWSSIENAAASPFEGFSDLWYRWRFAFSAWRWREREGGVPRYLFLALLPLFFFLIWRIYKNMRIKRVPQKEESTLDRRFYPGADSDFYAIEQALQDHGIVREPGESLMYWLQRLERSFPMVSFQVLKPILVLHYRYRFDPEGVTQTEKTELTSAVQTWLAYYEKKKIDRITHKE